MHHLVAHGVEVTDDLAAGSANFDTTKMFCGNAFEAFVSQVETYALLNNLIAGRRFDEFERLTIQHYSKLDKPGALRAVQGESGVHLGVRRSG